ADGKVDFGKAESVIDHAVERGINYFDSGYFYQSGDSERAMGRALKKYPRDSYYMATKLPSFRVKDRADILSVFEEQSERCQADYFDFYLYHNVNESSYADFTKDFVLDTLLELKDKGRIKRIGFSSHGDTDTLEKFSARRQWDIALIQLNYLDWTYWNAKKQYEILTEYKIPVAVMEPMRGGRFSTSITPEADQLMKSVSPDRDIASWALRFAASLPNVVTVLSGMNTFEQIDANAATMSGFSPFSYRERKTIKKVADILLDSTQVPCTGCRYCVDDCPAGLDIPRLMEIYNGYAISGHWMELLKLQALPSAGRPSKCTQCGACSAHCPQKIDIPSAIRKLREGSGRP
ncbi:MAG: aldo/keto reductase, partial [Clostridiales Family XIII bacterium]|nr:aldo/keto reductase [Clostridiales Family XIII bacterium]